MKRIAVLLFLLAALPALSSSSRSHEIEWITPEEEAVELGDDFPWQQAGPLEFLHYLRNEWKQDSDRFPWYTVRGYHTGWIRDADIPSLFEASQSKEPCLAILTPYSSILPSEPSTVGHESLFIIEGYRIGVYPPALVSTHWQPDEGALEKWWAGRKKHRKLTGW